MATLDDSGLGSITASRLKGETPVTSKKRPRVSSSAKTTSAVFKKRKMSIGEDRSKWSRFELNVSCDDFLTKGEIKSEGVMINGAEWFLAVHRRMNEVENASPSDKHLMVEMSLQCAVPSAAWYAKCKIDLEVVASGIEYQKSFDSMITSSSNSRGIQLDWRKYFLHGGRVSAYLLISRVCNKFLCFPDFSDPYETGIDELEVVSQTGGSHVLYVDKNLLSLNSRFFARLFSYGDGPYQLNGKVDDIVATLQTVYPQKGMIDDSNAFTIAVIANEFEFWDTLERCEQHIISSGKKFSTLEKIEIALRCQMHSLLSQCSEGLDSMENIFHLMDRQPEGFQASDRTKAYLFNLMVSLNEKATAKQVVQD